MRLTVSALDENEAAQRAVDLSYDRGPNLHAVAAANPRCVAVQVAAPD